MAIEIRTIRVILLDSSLESLDFIGSRGVPS